MCGVIITKCCQFPISPLALLPYSNPQVQGDVLQYGGLELLCKLLAASEPEVVQRRALFAISALLRGNPDPQQVVYPLPPLQ